MDTPDLKIPGVSLAWALLLLAAGGAAPIAAQSDPFDSGGHLSAEQASYDVTFYDLAVRVDPEQETIEGSLTAVVLPHSELETLVLDLVPGLKVRGVERMVGGAGAGDLPFERRGGEIRIGLAEVHPTGLQLAVRVRYGGRPGSDASASAVPRGVRWARTPAGDPWVTTSVEMSGADMWWPTKDHPSDEPDSMALHVTVPPGLVVASNGSLRQVTEEVSGHLTYHWFVESPINNYGVALNIAPYRLLERPYISTSGDTIPVTFWILPGSYDRGAAFMPEIMDHLRFLEEVGGPYPFRHEKYGVAQVPYLGMEHQTVIAYGANFDNGAMVGGVDWGFDALHHHELAHEWYGNAVTAADWKDLWLHEGLATYMQPLYLEHTQGRERYHAYMASIRHPIANQEPLAPRDPRTVQEIYGLDLYYKGAWVLHTLRYLVGDEAFRALLRRWVYPDPRLEHLAGRPPTRLVDTRDFVELAEQITGRELGWFFDVYLRQPDLPTLAVERSEGWLWLRWETLSGLPFPMPVDVLVGGELRRVEMPEGRAGLEVPSGPEVSLDPYHWILKSGG